MTAQTPPPGWYATNVPGEQRWWDGSQWTEHVSANPAAPTRLLGKSDPKVARGLGIAFTALGVLALILVFLLWLVLSFDSVFLPSMLVLFGLIFVALGVLSLIDARAGFRLRSHPAQQQAQPPGPHGE